MANNMSAISFAQTSLPPLVRVSLPPQGIRGGILTHGSVLTMTAAPTRTSPV